MRVVGRSLIISLVSAFFLTGCTGLIIWGAGPQYVCHSHLSAAISRGDAEGVAKELSGVLKSDPNKGECPGELPLLGATYSGNLAIGKILVKYGANPDYVPDTVSGNTLMMKVCQEHAGYAARHEVDSKRLVGYLKFLVEVGANVNARSAAGQTALSYCASSKDAFNMLAAAGADINIRDDIGQARLAKWAGMNPDFMREIIRRGAPVDLLMSARNLVDSSLGGVFAENFTVTPQQGLAILKAEGLDVNATFEHFGSKITLLQKALFRDQRADGVTEWLLSNGADPNKGQPIELVVSISDVVRQEKLLRLFLRAGADVNAYLSDGFTPLCKATYLYDRHQTIALLGRVAGDRLDLRKKCGRSGLTALELARRSGHQANVVAMEQLMQ